MKKIFFLIIGLIGIVNPRINAQETKFEIVQGTYDNNGYYQADFFDVRFKLELSNDNQIITLLLKDEGVPLDYLQLSGNTFTLKDYEYNSSHELQVSEYGTAQYLGKNVVGEYLFQVISFNMHGTILTTITLDENLQYVEQKELYFKTNGELEMDMRYTFHWDQAH